MHLKPRASCPLVLTVCLFSVSTLRVKLLVCVHTCLADKADSDSDLQVGHVQQVSLVPDRTHEMKTISLKPLLFGKCTVVFGYDLLYMNKWLFIRIWNTMFNSSQSHTNIDW